MYCLPQPFYGPFSGTTRVSWCQKNFWTLWCKGRPTEADTPTVRLGATPSGLTSAHLHHPPIFTGRMAFLPPNQQCQSTEGVLFTVCYTMWHEIKDLLKPTAFEAVVHNFVSYMYRICGINVPFISPESKSNLLYGC